MKWVQYHQSFFVFLSWHCCWLDIFWQLCRDGWSVSSQTFYKRVQLHS